MALDKASQHNNLTQTPFDAWSRVKFKNVPIIRWTANSWRLWERLILWACEKI